MQSIPNIYLEKAALFSAHWNPVAVHQMNWLEGATMKGPGWFQTHL